MLKVTPVLELSTALIVDAQRIRLSYVKAQGDHLESSLSFKY